MSGGSWAVPGGRITGTQTDEYGNPLLSSGIAADGTQGAGLALRRALAAGLYNGDFVFAPPSPDGEILSTNVLPYWTLTKVSGTQIAAYSITDTSSASGRVIRFVVSSGAANDETYIEQIVPVNGSRGQNFNYVVKAYFLAASGVVANLSTRLDAQFLKSDGITTTGTTDTTTSSFSASAGDKVVRPPAGTYTPIPTDAYFLRVRVGVVRTAGTTDTGTIDLCEVRVITGTDELSVVDQTTPANDYASVTKVGGVARLAYSGSAASSTASVTLQSTGATLTGGGTNASTLTVAVNSTGISSSISGVNGAKHVWVGGGWVLTPGSQTISAATDTVLASRGGVNAITVSGGPFTMTSAPTIADGSDGQIIILANVSGNAITIQDQGTLANSNLRLSTTTFAMATRDNITLMYSSTIGDWIEIARTNVL